MQLLKRIISANRVILSVLYIMTEVLRSHEDARLRDGFRAELNVPMEGGGGSNDRDHTNMTFAKLWVLFPYPLICIQHQNTHATSLDYSTEDVT